MRLDLGDLPFAISDSKRHTLVGALCSRQLDQVVNLAFQLEQALFIAAGPIVGSFFLNDSHSLLDHIVHVLRRQELSFESS